MEEQIKKVKEILKKRNEGNFSLDYCNDLLDQIKDLKEDLENLIVDLELFISEELV